MQDVLKTNDPVRLSFALALLREAGMNPVVMDEHISLMEGSIGVFPRRVLVADDDAPEARAILKDGLDPA